MPVPDCPQVRPRSASVDPLQRCAVTGSGQEHQISERATSESLTAALAERDRWFSALEEIAAELEGEVAGGPTTVQLVDLVRGVRDERDRLRSLAVAPRTDRRPPPGPGQVLVGLATLIGVILFVLAVATLAVWWWRWIIA